MPRCQAQVADRLSGQGKSNPPSILVPEHLLVVKIAVLIHPMGNDNFPPNAWTVNGQLPPLDRGKFGKRFGETLGPDVFPPDIVKRVGEIFPKGEPFPLPQIQKGFGVGNRVGVGVEVKHGFKTGMGDGV